MSLFRLLPPRLGSLINTVECRRWCSTVNDKGEILRPLQKSVVVEQQKAMAVETYEKKHMTEKEGVFPRDTHVQKEVGPWNNLVAIFQIAKKKIFGNHMEQKSSSTHALTSTSDLKDSDNVVSADSHDSGSMNKLKIAIHSEKISMTNMEKMADSETSVSSYADKSKGFEVVNMKNTSNSVGPEELLHISSKECEGSADFGVNGMSSGASSICRKANSNDSVQLINVFHHSELVEKEREQLLAEEASSSVQVRSGGEILSKSEEACILEHQMQVEIPMTSDRVSANKSGSTAPENQPEDIMELCKFLPNLELGRSDTSDSSYVSKRVARLVDVSQEKRNNEPELEAKNDQMQKEDVISDNISIFAKSGKSNLKQVAHSNSFLLSERTDKWQDVLAKKSVFSANEHHPAKDISIPISLSNSKMDEISSVSNNSSHMEADHRVIDQIVDPKSGKTVPREFEHLNETSQNSFGKRGNIKNLIECIGELPPQEPSVVRSKEIVVGGGVDRYTKRSSCVSKRVARLVDVSPEKRNNEPELESKNDQMQKKEVTSDIISIFAKKGKSNLKQVAHSNSFLLSERTDKWQDVLAKKSVFSANEHHPAKDISIPISLSNSKMDEISSVSNNSSHMEADHRVIDQIVDPKSGKTVPREFEHLNGTSQNSFGKRGNIKSLIECIGEPPPQEPSVVRSKEIVYGGGVDRYTKRSSCVSKRVARLVDVSPEKRNNEPELESKNDQMQKKEVTSDIISIFAKNGKSNLKQVAHSNSFLLSERTDKWQDVLAKKSVFSANEHHPAKDISIPISLSNSKMDEISSVSNNSSHMEADHRVIDQIIDPKSGNIVPREFEHLNGTSQNTFGERGNIKSLIECIRELPPQEPSVVRSKEIVVGGDVDRYTKRSASNSIQTQTDKQPFDRKKRKTSSQGVIGKKENSGLSNKVFEDLNPGDERTDIGNTARHGFCESIETKEIASLREKGNLNKSEDASLSEKLSDENKMTVKFVPEKATESDVSSAFKACGAITKVVFSSVKSTNFKVAHIYFESEEGRQKALKRSEVNIRNAVVLEATSPPKGRERMCIPDLIGYPKVPTSLVKHPSRTVIKKLKHNVSFHDIEEALAFCRSKITGIFFDLSRSVAYVEFETVEGKEIAIEKSSVIVLGERLSILRIDAPRTTVVRISNIHSPAMGKVISFCKELGKTAQFFMRTSGIMDVHFKFAEWPRMLEILNRLNGIEVDGQQLVAKPAPVYPPNVLNVLWNQPEGRKHLKTTFNSMLLKVGGDGAGTVGLTELVDRFYADVQER